MRKQRLYGETPGEKGARNCCPSIGSISEPWQNLSRVRKSEGVSTKTQKNRNCVRCDEEYVETRPILMCSTFPHQAKMVSAEKSNSRRNQRVEDRADFIVLPVDEIS